MTQTINIECISPEDASVLRGALSLLVGVDVEPELMLKAGPRDYKKVVSFIAIAAAITACAAAIVAELSALGYKNISINGKVVMLSVFSIEGALNATNGKEAGNTKNNGNSNANGVNRD